ncbi:hypothetical protein FC15_GL001036 [Lapidilactobacillus concavus DSM 17758]|uniref:Uncharacterized protein n=1 Tax=Lapidilactobacillus concavus DSM 17758 TaxID=1423735 RepID=A0A0R1W0Y7_9LACO|nr:hypothetical protein FC15_GL001036 [Lapidilactobacillus concavus DSM 17758]
MLRNEGIMDFIMMSLKHFKSTKHFFRTTFGVPKGCIVIIPIFVPKSCLKFI